MPTSLPNPTISRRPPAGVTRRALLLRLILPLAASTQAIRFTALDDSAAALWRTCRRDAQPA